jgi:cytochrome c biogenesis protein CcmG/thiol:disulfide interchange protein DsbE
LQLKKFAPLLLVLAAIAQAPALSAQSPLIGTSAPAITVTDLEGNEVTLDARDSGRPMLLEFWATWCEVCEALLPTMRAAAAEYGSKVDFVGINVTVNDPRRRVVRWVEKERPPYLTIYDARGLAVRTFRAPTTSYVVIVDAGGVIRYTGSGKDQDLLGELAKVTTK